MDPLIDLTEGSLTLLLLAAVILFGLGVGILTFYVALPAMRLARMVKRSYGDRLGKDLSKLSVSELKFLLLSFEKMFSDLETQEARVRTLAAAVAHEVRNSAAAIRGVAERLPASARRPSREIREESLQLERTARAFLDFTRPLEPRWEKTDLAEIVSSQAKIHAIAAKKRRLRLISGRGQVRAPLEADPGLLRQMLGNLLANALRAAPRGGRVELSVEGKPDEEAWRLRVADNGPGVPERLKARLFEPFSGHEPGGTGLGLAIARRIAEAHHGSLALEETGPQGAVFLVTLPRRQAPGTRKAAAA